MSGNIKTISLLILWLVSLTTTKADHLVTNVVKCASVYYYGIRADGGITEQVLCECKAAHFENSMHDGKHPEWVTVFKTSVRVQPTVCWRTMDGVANVRPAGATTRRLPQVTPPMPVPLPAKKQASLSLPSALPTVVSDTTPPTINSFEVSQSVIGDFSTLVPTSVKFVHLSNGAIIDEHTGVRTTNAFQVTFQGFSNTCYVVWCSSNLKSATWLEYPIYGFCPIIAAGQSQFVIYLPVLPTGRRFYQLRSS